MVAQRFAIAKRLEGRAKEGGGGRSRSEEGGGGGGGGGGASGRGGGGGGLRDSAAAAAVVEEEACRGTDHAHRRSSVRPLKVLDVCTGSGVQV